MKLLKWAVGGASAYVIYKYSIGRKAKGEDVFVTPEKAVEKIAAETGPKKKPAPRKPAVRATAAKAPAEEAASGDTPASGKPKRKPRKKPQTP